MTDSSFENSSFKAGGSQGCLHGSHGCLSGSQGCLRGGTLDGGTQLSSEPISGPCLCQSTAPPGPASLPL